jgi:hypothetical protein
MTDTIVDTVAKLLCPPDNLNWHMWRDYARTILKPAAQLDSGELAAVLAAPDREVTHEELRGAA